jgi:hypothetical protein
VKHSYLLFLAVPLLLLAQLPAQAQRRHGARSLDYSRLYRTHFYRGPAIFSFGLGQAASRGDYCGRWRCNFLGRYLSVGLTYPIQPGISVGGDLEYFRLGANESRPNDRHFRNISFRGENVALTGHVRINLRNDPSQFPGNVRARQPLFIPYVKVGIGGMVYSAFTYEGRKQYEAGGSRVLKSKHEYPDVAVVVPLGGGLAIRLSKEVSLNPELVYHITSTDYLDDMKIFPTHKRTDHYGIASLKVLYTPSKQRMRRMDF